jgi:hypothetical protein
MIQRTARRSVGKGIVLEQAFSDNPFQSPRDDAGGYIDPVQGNYSDDDDLGTGHWILAALCSGLGCGLGLLWLIQGKPKGAKLMGASLLFAIFWNVAGVVIRYLGGIL